MENNKKSWLERNKTDVLMVAYLVAFIGWLGIMGHSWIHNGAKQNKTEQVKKSVGQAQQTRTIQYNDSIKTKVR